MCLRLSARRILQRYASNLANLVSSDKIRHVFIPSYQYRYASSYWLFCRWFLWKMQNIWRPGFLSKEIPASHADTDCWQSDEWNDWDGERDVKLRPLCLERNLQWFYGQLNYTAPEQKWSRNQYLQHDRSQTCLSTLSEILNEWICSILGVWLHLSVFSAVWKPIRFWLLLALHLLTLS